MKDFIRNCSLLLQSIKQEWRERKTSKFMREPTDDEEPANGYEVVQTMNTFGKDIARSLNIQRFRRKRRKEVLPISSEQIDMEVSVVSTNGFAGYTFPDPTSKLNVTDSIKLPPEIFANSVAENGTIISMVYDALFEMSTPNATSDFLNATLNSKVLSSKIYPRPSGKLMQPVEIILSHLKRPNSTSPECVFWKVNQSDPSEGFWSSYGCTVFTSNISHTVCHCNHLTDFAVLFRVSKTKKLPEEHRQALTLISLAGCFISSVCLMITVVVLIVLRKLLRSTRNMLHLNLAVALLLANILFLVSDKVVSSKNLCLGISLGLFYFFLAAFCLMLGEGIYIWIMVAKAFSENLKKWMYAAVGWGIPLIIVGVSFAILRFNMVSRDFCWLSVSSGAIWAFVGPVAFIITVNFCILMKALCIAVEHQTDGSSLKVSARLTLLLMPILGLTWLFGVFAMNEETLVFDYLFTIFNSLQGLFIFVCYILCNGEVKSEYQKLKAKKEYSLSLQPKSSSSTKESRDRRSRTGTQNEEMIQMVA